jgi:hypothetical protein
VPNIQKFNTNLDTHIHNYTIKLNNNDKRFLYNIYKAYIHRIYSIIGRKIDS